MARDPSEEKLLSQRLDGLETAERGDSQATVLVPFVQRTAPPSPFQIAEAISGWMHTGSLRSRFLSFSLSQLQSRCRSDELTSTERNAFGCAAVCVCWPQQWYGRDMKGRGSHSENNAVGAPRPLPDRSPTAHRPLTDRSRTAPRPLTDRSPTAARFPVPSVCVTGQHRHSHKARTAARTATAIDDLWPSKMYALLLATVCCCW